MISPDPGLISEKDRGADLRCRSLDLRVGLLLPHADPLGILLVGPIQGPLRRHAQLRQNPPHRRQRQPHLKFQENQITDQLAGPQRHPKTVLARVAAYDQRIQLHDLLIRQRRWTSRRELRRQRREPPTRYIACHAKTEERPTWRMSATSSAEYPRSSSCTARRRSSFVARRPFLAMTESSHANERKSRNMRT